MAAQQAYKYDMGYAAPKRAPETEKKVEKKPELKTVKRDKLEDAISSEKATNKKIVKVAVLLCVLIAMFGMVCNSFSVRDQAKMKLDKLQDEYVFAQSENREIKVKLNNLVSAVNIDEIAANRLGLVKVNAANEIYLDTSDGNKVVYIKTDK